ncbi:MAG: C4-type zinc ribbon domain-containing protein [Polyangiaceae bacterium]
MTIQNQIPLIEALADIDERLRQVDEDIALRRGGLTTLRAEIEALNVKITSGRESVATMEKTRNELYVELRSMQSQLEKSREKLGRSRNERESVAAQREAEELRKLIRDREDEIEKLETVANRAKTSVSDAETKQGELQRELEGDAEGVAKALHDRERERGELAAQRAVQVKSLPPILVRRYDTIRGRRARAIASTHDGTCNGCHIAVTPMMFQKMLRQEEFEQCPNCRRLLYYVPKPSNAESSG